MWGQERRFQYAARFQYTLTFQLLQTLFLSSILSSKVYIFINPLKSNTTKSKISRAYRMPRRIFYLANQVHFLKHVRLGFFFCPKSSKRFRGLAAFSLGGLPISLWALRDCDSGFGVILLYREKNHLDEPTSTGDASPHHYRFGFSDQKENRRLH